MEKSTCQDHALLLLQQWNLSQYFGILEKNNCQNTNGWNNLTLSQLLQFGFKTGHAKRFIKNVKNIPDSLNNAKNEPNNIHTNVVLLGETGVGKSTLIHCIDAFINDSEFEELDYTKKSLITSNSQSQTQDCHIHKLSLLKNCYLTLIDTPGIGDTSGILKDRENIDKIMKCLFSDKLLNNGINVFAFLIQRGTNRATTKLKYIVNQLKCYLPQSAINHFIVILTRSSVEY